MKRFLQLLFSKLHLFFRVRVLEQIIHRSQEICKHLKIEEQPARIMLLGLTSTKFLKKKGGYYSNNFIAERLLNRNNPQNVIPYVELEHRVMYPGMYHFYESVKKGKNVGLKAVSGTENTLYERLSHHPKIEKTFQEAMQVLSAKANKDLVQFVDFSRVQHLLDTGGGDGTNIIALAKKFPGLHATVLDISTVCEIAKKNITKNRLENRLTAISGDIFKDKIPAGVDCILFGHFCTIWSPEENLKILKKCYHALPRGGSVVIFNMCQSDNNMGPLTAAGGSPYFLAIATGKGMLYTAKEYETWMKNAGFGTVTRKALPMDHIVITGTKE